MPRTLVAVLMSLLLGPPAIALEPIPDKLVVLTFDDSAKSHYTVARPILMKYHFGATFFITEGFDFPTNKNHYMTWEEIAQLQKDGFEIGNHTRDHLGVTTKTLADLPAQLRGINEQCKKHGIPQPTSFAYPGNAITKDALAVLKDSGIRFARRGGAPEFPYKAGRGFAYEPGFDHALLIPSAGDARPAWTLDDFVAAVAQAKHGKIAVLQFHGVPDTAHDWVNSTKLQFESYMKYLADNKFTVIAMRDLAKFVDPAVNPSDPFGVIEDRKKLIATLAMPAAQPIKHAFLATGGETFIVDESGKVIWNYPHSSRDGWVLEGGNVLLAFSKSRTYPGGAAVEVTRDGKELFEYKGTQSEVNTVQPLDGGNVLLTEAGDRPRILEVDRGGRVVAEVPIQAQTKDHHLQTRMTRKLANGNYLVPQLLDRVVREYDPKGKVVWEAKTPHMPFTAIRLPDGNTLIGCTLGNLVIEANKDGKEVWRVINDDLPGKPINDACGVQRLANGNTVITSHHATAGHVKLLEVTRDKKVVWTYTDDRKGGIHHFQILDAAGKPEKKPLR